jgi:dihydrofolate synthase/folylpolyglutamate synthase
MESPEAPRSLSQWLELLESRHPKSIDLGLERVAEVWLRMGSPRPARRIFTVAGTNGKGSTVAYLCHMLKALGYRIGSYTTPHLLRYNERIQIEGSPASDGEIVTAFERIEAVRGDVSLTYFEFGTLAAISLMSEHVLDFAVLEVGLGGRLDAVNILDCDCAVITPIGLDHQDYLGPDRESIGREKAGIIRRRVPVVCGEAEPPASVLSEAMRLDAPILRSEHEFSAQRKGRMVEFQWKGQSWELPLPAMRGEHQVANMATSVAALLELLPEAVDRMESVARGLQEVAVPGRMQQLCRSPLVLVDVGHNPLAAKVVARTIEEASHIRPGGQCLCVFGMLKDKDAAEVAAILRPQVSAWYCAGLAGERGRSGLDLSSHVLAVDESAHVLVCNDVESAFEQALQDASPNDCVLVFGSFLTAAAAIAHWKSRPPAAS